MNGVYLFARHIIIFYELVTKRCLFEKTLKTDGDDQQL